MDDWREGWGNGVGGNESSEHMRQGWSERWAWQCGGVLIHMCMMHGAKLSTCGQTGGETPEPSLHDGWRSHEKPVENWKPDTYEWAVGSTGAKPHYCLMMGWYVESLTPEKRNTKRIRETMFWIWCKPRIVIKTLMHRTQCKAVFRIASHHTTACSISRLQLLIGKNYTENNRQKCN